MAKAREGEEIENTASSTVELEPSTEYTRLATKSDIYSNGVIRLISKTHDISLVDEHISSIKHLAADLDKAVKAVWPRRQDLRYTQIHVLLIRWEDDDLGVVTEVQELKHVFQHIYNYSVETYDIPSVMPQRTLNRRIQEFLKYDEKNGDETLLIVYYAGHARRVPDSNEPPLWFANRTPASAATPCAGIQSLLEESQSDVLLLYDCCHSAPTRTNRCPQSRKSVTEAISACGYETIAPEVDQHSFSRALIQTLAAASQGLPFSVGELHTWVLGRLKCWLPSLAQNEDGNFIRHADGRLAYEHQPRRTPIYSILCETEPRRSIVLAPLRNLTSAGSANSNYGVNKVISPPTENSGSLLGSRNPFRKPGASTAEVDQHPQILLAIRLEKAELDIQTWRDWVRNLPAEGKDIKIEGVYRSFSTLVLPRMPVAVWDPPPENPAHSSAGFVTSENTGSIIYQMPAQEEDIPVASLVRNRAIADNDSKAWLGLASKSAAASRSIHRTSRNQIDGIIRQFSSSLRDSLNAGPPEQDFSRRAIVKTISHEHSQTSHGEKTPENTKTVKYNQHTRVPSPFTPRSSPLREDRSSISEHISFIDGQFDLIHIPLHLYSQILQPILRGRLSKDTQSASSSSGELPEGAAVGHKLGFFSISITPLGCSVVCSSTWTYEMFGPDIAARLPTGNLKRVHISKDTYSVLCINRAGLEAGLLELMASLAVVGIPIFFITTFSTDYILVPSKDRQTVENLLSTPHTSTINELQTRTISQLKQKNVRPFVEPGLQLVLCSGIEVAGEDENSTRPSMIPSWLENIDHRFCTGLTSALAHQPRFLSVTLSQDNPPSLLIDKSLLGLFGDSIVSDRGGNLVPLFLDLVDLPSEFTGIECGVAEALTDEMMKESKRIASHGWELSFLSMAQAGALILASENKDMALGVLLRLFD